VDEKPPPIPLIMLGLQQVAIISVSLVIPMVIAETAGAPAAVVRSVLSLSMMSLAILCVLQALSRRHVGSGYLVPGFCSANYLHPSLQAAAIGGMPLVLGMTIFAGLFECLMSQVIPKLRKFVPPEISGIAITIMGIELGQVGFQKLLAQPEGGAPHSYLLISGFLTVGAMLGANIWGGRTLRLYAALIGLLIGCGFSIAHGAFPDQVIAQLTETPTFALPSIDYISWDFEWALAVPFMIGALASLLTTIAAVTTCQKINDSGWERPDMGSISRGVLADGLGTVIAASIGSSGLNSATSGVAMSSATGATSRYIAFGIAGWLLVMACSPQFATLFMVIPKPVLGAALLYIACFMLVSGIEIIASRPLDVRRTAVVGVSLILAIGQGSIADNLDSLPHYLHPITESPLALGVVTAIVLNTLARLGVRRSAAIDLLPSATAVFAIDDLMERLPRQWSVRRDVMDSARFCFVEVVEAIAREGHVRGSIEARVSFDEWHLDIELHYLGTPLPLQTSPIQVKEVVANQELLPITRLTSVFLVNLADQVRSYSNGTRNVIRLKFQH
jgi:NCS2 family nucleobase:cation symporter-2